MSFPNANTLWIGQKCTTSSSNENPKSKTAKSNETTDKDKIFQENIVKQVKKIKSFGWGCIKPTSRESSWRKRAAFWDAGILDFCMPATEPRSISKISSLVLSKAIGNPRTTSVCIYRRRRRRVERRKIFRAYVAYDFYVFLVSCDVPKFGFFSMVLMHYSSGQDIQCAPVKNLGPRVVVFMDRVGPKGISRPCLTLKLQACIGPSPRRTWMWAPRACHFSIGLDFL